MLSFFDDQSPGSSAALASGHKGRLDDDRSGRVEIRRIPNDQRIIAAEFECQDLVWPGGKLLVQRHAAAH